MMYTLNFITCVEMFGPKLGIELIKYYDSQYLFSILIGVVVNFLVSADRFGIDLVAYIFCGICVVGLALMLCVKK